MKMTPTLRIVLDTMAARHPEAMYGLEITRATGLKSGTVYPMLDRLVEAGWCTAAWEDADLALAHGRTRRHYFGLTDRGLGKAREAMTISLGGRLYRLVPVADTAAPRRVTTSG